MSATQPVSSFDQARAIREAEELLRHPGATVSVVGQKPWYQRALSKMRGPAAVLFCYASALASFPLGPSAVTADQAGESINLLGKQTFLMSPVELKPLFSFQKEAPGVPAAAAFDVPENMASQQVAQKLFELGKPFQALAVTLEGLETKPYRDGCGLNVGMGYCIDARVREYGPARIRQDLLGAGLTAAQTDTLMGNDRKAQGAIELTRTQALALLSLTEGDYRTRARDLLGQKVFDALPSHRQAVMTWLSYNTGEGLGRFNRLLTAVRQDRTSDAVQHMTPFFSQGGQMVPNARAGSWLMAAYWSNDAMKAALARPDALESGARNGQSPLEVVAPKEAGRLALRGALPQSPYVAHGLTELKSLGVTEVQVAQVDTNVVVMPAPSDWRAQRQAASQPQVGVEAPVQTQQAPEAQDSAIGVNPQDLLDNLPSSSRRKPGM
jgi:GH24 family phage-related lysozyme (muramidase)